LHLIWKSFPVHNHTTYCCKVYFLYCPICAWPSKWYITHGFSDKYFVRVISFTYFNAQFLCSLTICMLHYNPRHFSSINIPIFRRTNCIFTASGIVTLCKRLYDMPDESRLLCGLLSSSILCNLLQRVTIPDAVIIQFVLLKMGILMLETFRGL
jgi:hypothetical protein